MLNKLHLNNVHCDSNGMYISGLQTGGMLHFNGKTVLMSAELPPGSHNARPFRDGVLFNDSEAHVLRYWAVTPTLKTARWRRRLLRPKTCCMLTAMTPTRVCTRIVCAFQYPGRRGILTLYRQPVRPGGKLPPAFRQFEQGPAQRDIRPGVLAVRLSGTTTARRS